MTTTETTNPANEQLLADVESFLQLGKDATVNEPGTAQIALSTLIEQTEESIVAIDSSLQSTAVLLTEPLRDGNAAERYSALTEAERAQFQAWKDLQRLISVLSEYHDKWREYAGEIQHSINSYSNVFGFPLPDGMRPQNHPDSGDFTTPDGVSF